MKNIQVWDLWHQQPMNINNTTDVNPIPCDPGYPDSCKIGKGPYTGCVDFVFKSTPEMGGALFSPKTDVPLPTNFKPLYFGFNRRVQSLTPDQEGRDEFDVKWTLAGGLQLNGSNQINWSKNGMWQVDPSGGAWIDSGFAVTRQPGWNEFMVRWNTDGAKWNINTLFCNGTTYNSLPASCRGIALIKTTWGTGGHMQLQEEVMNCPAFAVVRYQNAQLIISDATIPLQWF